MKKSGSKTRPQLGSQLSPNFTRQERQSGKLPNYMKSTTSADAIIEQSKLSTNSPKTSLHGKGSTNSPNLCFNSSKNVLIASSKRTASSRPERTSVRKGTTDGNLEVERATCSSTLKGSKFPDYLKLNPGEIGSEGTSAGKVCPYSYCSFNGHLHARLPPLKCFVLARRLALKAERSIKLRCQSPKARPIGNNPYCVDIIGKDEPATSNGEEDVPSNLEQIGDPYLDDDYECTTNVEKETATCADFITESDDKFGRFFDEISVDRVSQESFDEDSLNSDSLFIGDNWESVGSHGYLESLSSKNTSAPVFVQDDASFEGNDTPSIVPQSSDTTMSTNAVDEEERNLKGNSISNEDATIEIGNQAYGPVEEITSLVDGNKCKAIKHDQDRAENECNQAENFNGASSKDLTNEPYTGDSGLNSSEGECIANYEFNSRNTTMPETEEKSFRRAAVRCKKSNQESDDPRRLNPCGLQLLPMEPERGAEKVNLRHQEPDARKNAKEWMVDYALRQAVTKGGTSSSRKVALLVEAFERVLPTSKH